MEHREPPRIFNAEVRGREPIADDPEPPWRRFPHFTPPHHVRRLRPHGVALVVIAGLLLATSLFFGLRAAFQAVVGYLEKQTEYQLLFEDIRLDPDPPAWIRGGRRAFLERIRKEGRLPASFSTLNPDLPALRAAFQRDAWIARVGRIDNLGHQIVVPLSYREPVALALFGDKEIGPAVDAEGFLLPASEIDEATTSTLVCLRNFPRPINPQFGIKWSRVAPSQGDSDPDPQVEIGARLAAYLRDKRKTESANAHPPPKIVVFGGPNLGWVQFGADLFYWGVRSPRLEATELGDEAKWAMMRAHVRAQPTLPGSDPSRRFKFTHGGLVEFRP